MWTILNKFNHAKPFSSDTFLNLTISSPKGFKSDFGWNMTSWKIDNKYSAFFFYWTLRSFVTYFFSTAFRLTLKNEIWKLKIRSSALTLCFQLFTRSSSFTDIDKGKIRLKSFLQRKISFSENFFSSFKKSECEVTNESNSRVVTPAFFRSKNQKKRFL